MEKISILYIQNTQAKSKFVEGERQCICNESCNTALILALNSFFFC